MEGKERAKNNKMFAIVLSALCFIILVLVVVIVVLKILEANKNLAEECVKNYSGSDLTFCIAEEVYAYYSQGDCEKALKVYDDVDPEAVEAETLEQVYSYAVGTSISCNDEEAEAAWNEKLSGIMPEDRSGYGF